MLSAMQQRIYDYIAACIQTQGYPPAWSGRLAAVGLRSLHRPLPSGKSRRMPVSLRSVPEKDGAITLTHPAALSVPEPEEPAGPGAHRGQWQLAVPFWLRVHRDHLTFHTGHPGDVHFAPAGPG